MHFLAGESHGQTSSPTMKLPDLGIDHVLFVNCFPADELYRRLINCGWHDVEKEDIQLLYFMIFLELLF